MSDLTLKLSAQLHDKLVRTAQDEGVGVEALVAELLAEGVTLRAWEILERKSAMRIPSQGGGNQRSGPGGNGHGPGGNHGGPRRTGAPNNAWMEDKAAFLEYVRNQEKQRRR